MVWLVGAAGHRVTTPAPCTWTHHVPSPALPGCPELGVGLLGFGFLIIIKFKFFFLLPIRCNDPFALAPSLFETVLLSSNVIPEAQGEKMGIGSTLHVVPNLSKSIGRGNPRRTHPKDAGAEPFVSMVTGEMGPGMERGL